ncbi:hypothetical protein [Clostridium sp. UBA1353]|uniref:hypothetical protein n=1 Tax=Clostridium sp. UBA1353 TaxID=1946347 RepID=UPI0032176A34
MKKNVKVLSGALAASLTMGAMPVFAADMSADELYKAAFEAVLAAQEARTQESINAARTAIKALVGTDAEFAVGEFSKQVDPVQQELFEGFLAALDKAQESNKQADINAARTYVEMFRTCPDTLVYVEGGWSQEVDLVQQKLIDKAEAAVNEAKEAKTQEAIDAAKALLEELATSTNKDVTDWVTAIEAELEAVVVDKATPAVVLAEKTLLEADLEAAKKLVAELEESDAKILLEARLAKVQLTINGIIASVNAADTEVKLYAAINRAPFTGVDINNIVAYKAAIGTGNTTIAQIQEKINLVNTGLTEAAIEALVDTAKGAMAKLTTTPNGSTTVDGVAVKNIVIAQEAVTALPEVLPESVATNKTVTVDYKAKSQAVIEEMKIVIPVMDSANQIQLLAALQNSAFVRVNADFIVQYESVKTKTTVVAIQEVIDAQNLLKTQAAVGAAETDVTTDKVNAAQVLVSALKADAEGETIKAGLQNRLDVVKAVIAVKEAKSEATLLTALKSEVLALTDVNEAVIKEYKAIIDDAARNVTVVDKATVQSEVVAKGNDAALATAVNTVETKFANYDATKAEDKATALVELNRLADVSTVNKDTVDAGLIAEYMTAIKADLTSGSATITGTDIQKAAAIQTIITAANGAKSVQTRLAAVNNAITAVEMRTALTAVAIAETNGYVDLTSQEKLEVAELVLVARANETDKKFADTTAVTTAIGKATTDRSTFLTNVNAAGNISAMVTALDVAEFSEFKALSSLEKVDVAELVLNALKELKAKTTPEEFKTIAEIRIAAGL